MEKLKNILLVAVVALLMPVMPAWGENWLRHPSRSGFTDRIIDTPDYTYFLELVAEYLPYSEFNQVKRGILYRYDKEGDEIRALGSKLTERLVRTVAYNPAQRYLMIGYVNGNIDILPDKGEVINIPGLKLAGAEYPKNINSIHFSPAHNRAYVATDFGFIEIDDRKGAVVRTHRLGQKVTAVTRYADRMIIGIDDAIYTAPVDVPLRMDDLKRFSTLLGIHRLYPVADRLLVWSGPDDWTARISAIFMEGGEMKIVHAIPTKINAVEQRVDGIHISTPGSDMVMDETLTARNYNRPPENYERIAGSWSGSDFWYAKGAAGMMQMRHNQDADEAGKWTVLKMLHPNAALPFVATDIVYHPTEGMLVRNAGTTPYCDSYDLWNHDLLSSYKNHTWKTRSPNILAGEGGARYFHSHPIGIVTDPLNPNHVYSGSVMHGMLRADLADPAKSLRLGRSNDWGNGSPGFIAAFDPAVSWDAAAIMSAPAFDTKGNLWVVHVNFDERDPDNNLNRGKGVELWCWPPAERLASTDGASYRAPKVTYLKDAKISAMPKVVPLTIKGYENLIFFSACSYTTEMAIMDTKGTPDDFSDDAVTMIPTVEDQDYTMVEFYHLQVIYQDPAYKRVWVGTNAGVFWFEPRELMEKGMVHRIKISRNDGTNLADYLLDNASVTEILRDPQGNLWFATMGGGLVVVSPDGGTVLRTYTVQNSGIPSNNVYALCYNPEENAMMMSSDEGLASLYLNQVSESETTAQLKCYPNPVRPDYYGYVTVEGLPQDALVKVVDVKGNLVKELDPANAGETRWDVTDMHMKRVQGGVYYVLASGGSSESSFAASAKILVVN